jgi:hypothetical protein
MISNGGGEFLESRKSILKISVVLGLKVLNKTSDSVFQ